VQELEDIYLNRKVAPCSLFGEGLDGGRRRRRRRAGGASNPWVRFWKSYKSKHPSATMKQAAKAYHGSGLSGGAKKNRGQSAAFLMNPAVGLADAAAQRLALGQVDLRRRLISSQGPEMQYAAAVRRKRPTTTLADARGEYRNARDEAAYLRRRFIASLADANGGREYGPAASFNALWAQAAAADEPTARTYIDYPAGLPPAT
jgi:hypothetical protein